MSLETRRRAMASSAVVQIKERALQLGFSKVGIARVESLAEERSRLQQWIARGHHGEMKWMERDPAQRTDPRLFFPPARSVIVVALNYYTEHEHEVSIGSGPGPPSGQPAWGGGSDRVERHHEVGATTTGKISRYAW